MHFNTPSAPVLILMQIIIKFTNSKLLIADDGSRRARKHGAKKTKYDSQVHTAISKLLMANDVS